MRIDKKGMFIRFNEMEEKTEVFNHRGEYLGDIWFNDEWKIHKQWCFSPMSGSFFTTGCLIEIVEKLKELNAKKGYNEFGKESKT